MKSEDYFQWTIPVINVIIKDIRLTAQKGIVNKNDVRCFVKMFIALPLGFATLLSQNNHVLKSCL